MDRYQKANEKLSAELETIRKGIKFLFDELNEKISLIDALAQKVELAKEEIQILLDSEDNIYIGKEAKHALEKLLYKLEN